MVLCALLNLIILLTTFISIQFHAMDVTYLLLNFLYILKSKESY
jgi:hypothetical protein